MRSGNQAKFIAHAQKLGATPAGQEALMGLKKEFAGGLDAAGNPVVGADGYPLELTGNKKQIWNKVMEPNKDFIKDYAPDLDRGSRAFDNVKREDAQKWGAETTGRYVNHMNQNKTRLDALKAKGNDLTDDDPASRQNHSRQHLGSELGRYRFVDVSSARYRPRPHQHHVGLYETRRRQLLDRSDQNLRQTIFR